MNMSVCKTPKLFEQLKMRMKNVMPAEAGIVRGTNIHSDASLRWHDNLQSAIKVLLSQGLPSKNHEQWRHFDLSILEQFEFVTNPKAIDVLIPPLAFELNKDYPILQVVNGISMPTASFVIPVKPGIQEKVIPAEAGILGNANNQRNSGIHHNDSRLDSRFHENDISICNSSKPRNESLSWRRFFVHRSQF